MLKRYNHNRSNTELTSFDMGKITATMIRHCIQGTTVRGGVSAGLELAPMVHQALSQIRVDTFAIACADRLVWDDAEKFYTGGETGEERPEVPYILAPAETGWPVGSTADHLGFQTGVPGLKCNALPFRVLVKWWNENIRDPQIQDELPLSTASGLDTTTYTGDLYMNWPKDLWTTAKLNQQLGDEVLIPIAESAPVEFTGDSNITMRLPATSSDYSYKAVEMKTNSSGYVTGINSDVTGNLQVNLQNATGILPSDFNLSMARQKWKQRRSLYGSAYRDLLAFLGVKYSDRRLGYVSTLAHGKNLVDISGVCRLLPDQILLLVKWPVVELDTDIVHIKHILRNGRL